MEMLGKELLCPDESCDEDDNISVDSFPELPNAVEHSRFCNLKNIVCCPSANDRV